MLSKQGVKYRVLYGGRGSGKSTAFATEVISKALSNRRILCCREIQNSIRDSVHKLLCDRIKELDLVDFFTVTQDSIKSVYGSEIIFRGLKSNTSEIKSLQGISIVWVEEAEKVSESSWEILIPTIRDDDAEIWVSFNPESESSPAYQRFVVNQRDDYAVAKINWQDNQFFPKTLHKEMEYCKRVDFEKYMHVWEGEVKKYGEAVIFKNKFVVEEFDTPADAEFRFGADFGFSNDPSVLGRMFIKGRELFIDYEAYGHGIEIEELPAFYDSVPESRKWKITADCERPDTISFLARKGFTIVGAEKGKGSVEDGIQFLRGFERIVIHPRCKGAVDNFSNYKWKLDRITQEVLPVPADGSDHWPDTARYALESYMKAKIPQVLWL